MKTVNKTIILLVLVLMLTTGFIQQPSNISVTIATATTGGFWHPIGISLGDLITSYIPGVTATVQTTGGAIENLRLLSAGEADLVMAYDYQVARLNSGTLPAVSDSSQPVRIVLGLYEQPLHIVTRVRYRYHQCADLKGKHISTSAPNSGAEEQAGFVFKALGIDWNKDIIRQKLGVTESVAALKTGQIDAFFWSGALPSTASSTRRLQIWQQILLSRWCSYR
ncbi:MAG: TAXI family TRAP transporter solute-binding subunit [Flexilinea sp.]